MRLPRFRLSVCLLAAVALAGSVLESASHVAASREEFLSRVNAALAARDARAILALSDVDAWKRAGQASPEPDKLTLPEGPLSRVRDLSDTDVLYKDARGRQWRLSITCAADGTWKAVIHDRACPRGGGMERDPRWAAPTPERPAPATWTPLECWPLPV